MALRIFTSIALVGALGILPACGDDTGTTENGSTSNNPTNGTEPTGGSTADEPTGAAADGPICTNFGGQAGVEAVIGSFLGKVLANESINAYFLTTDTDAANLSMCLSTQVGAAVGCAGVQYTCMDMKTAHAGMGISTADFTDLAGDFQAAMDEVATLTTEDKTTVIGVLADMAPDIVEDKDNNITIYQRLGRKPGINTVIGGPEDPKSFVALVAGDATINTFFAASDLARLKTCLVRQVTGATAGGEPLGSIYGKEVVAPMGIDPGVSTDKPCLDMVASHKDLKDGADMGIEKADFDALVGHLVTAMTNYNVSPADQNAIGGVLGGLCSSIVTVDPAACG
ncbi:MAG: hypothetical protein JNK56_31285 [Myxococcales bacterium]|nr:hypothetical protein [Myxococcales bacterium]